MHSEIPYCAGGLCLQEAEAGMRLGEVGAIVFALAKELLLGKGEAPGGAVYLLVCGVLSLFTRTS